MAKLVQIKNLLDSKHQLHLREERKRLITNATNAMNELEQFRSSMHFLDENEYKELLDIPYTKCFYARNY